MAADPFAKEDGPKFTEFPEFPDFPSDSESDADGFGASGFAQAAKDCASGDAACAESSGDEIEITRVKVAAATKRLPATVSDLPICKKRRTVRFGSQAPDFDPTAAIQTASADAQQSIAVPLQKERKQKVKKGMKVKKGKKGKKSKKGKQSKKGGAKLEKGMGKKVVDKASKESNGTEQENTDKAIKNTEKSTGMRMRSKQGRFKQVDNIMLTVHSHSGQAEELPNESLVKLRKWKERKKLQMALRYDGKTVIGVTVSRFGTVERAAYIFEQFKAMFLRGFARQQLEKVKEILCFKK